MKTVERFAQHNGVWLRAVQQVGTAVTDLSNRLSLPRYQLYEVWLLPSNEPVLTPEFLKEAGFKTADELLKFYQVENSAAPMHATSKEMELLAAFAINLTIDDAVFNFSLQNTGDGPIISAVFGSRAGMNAMYDHALRMRVVEVDDEPST